MLKPVTATLRAGPATVSIPEYAAIVGIADCAAAQHATAHALWLRARHRRDHVAGALRRVVRRRRSAAVDLIRFSPARARTWLSMMAPGCRLTNALGTCQVST